MRLPLLMCAQDKCSVRMQTDVGMTLCMKGSANLEICVCMNQRRVNEGAWVYVCVCACVPMRLP